MHNCLSLSCSGQKIIFYFIIAYASTILVAASIPSQPLNDCIKKSAGLTGVGGPPPPCYCTGALLCNQLMLPRKQAGML